MAPAGIAENAAPGSFRGKVIHPLWVRVTHCINAIAIMLMTMSGWQIYNASPLFPFSFSTSITIGGWLGGALQWHFAAMWLFTINGLVYVALGTVTGRFRRKLFPIRPSEVLAMIRDAVSVINSSTAKRSTLPT